MKIGRESWDRLSCLRFVLRRYSLDFCLMEERRVVLVNRAFGRALWLGDRLAEAREERRRGGFGVNDVSLFVTRIGFLQMSFRKRPLSYVKHGVPLRFE